MKTKTIKTAFSLADPESGFQFRSLKEDVLLTFQDWSATEVSIKFINCSHFSCGVIPLKYEDYDEQFLIIEDSQLIKDLDLENDGYKHFMISTNEGDWCEAIAENYELK